MRHAPLGNLSAYLFGRVRHTLNRRNSDRWLHSSFTDRFSVILRLLEVGNTLFLTSIIIAQTTGAYVVCIVASSVFTHRN